VVKYKGSCLFLTRKSDCFNINDSKFNPFSWTHPPKINAQICAGDWRPLLPQLF